MPLREAIALFLRNHPYFESNRVPTQPVRGINRGRSDGLAIEGPGPFQSSANPSGLCAKPPSDYLRFAADHTV